LIYEIYRCSPNTKRKYENGIIIPFEEGGDPECSSESEIDE